MSADADLDALPSEAEVAAVSVAPDRLARVRDAFPHLRVVGESIPLPIAVHYDPPEACGRDRVMAVVGALHRMGLVPDPAGAIDHAVLEAFTV